jgi:hypothetical protein
MKMPASINPDAGEDARTTAGQETGGTGFNAILRAAPSTAFGAMRQTSLKITVRG